jgi:ribosomal protein L7/L12
VDDALLARRFEAIERQLRLISEQLGIDCPPFAGDALAPAGSGPGLPGEVVELARAGHTTQAISRMRQLTGASLLEAKRAVDAL